MIRPRDAVPLLLIVAWCWCYEGWLWCRGRT